MNVLSSLSESVHTLLLESKPHASFKREKVEGQEEATSSNARMSSLTEVELKVKTIDGRLIELKVAAAQKVSQVKEMVARLTDVAPELQRLIFGGKVLKDTSLLNEYKGILDGASTIHMVAKPKDSVPPADSAPPGTPAGAAAGAAAGASASANPEGRRPMWREMRMPPMGRAGGAPTVVMGGVTVDGHGADMNQILSQVLGGLSDFGVAVRGPANGGAAGAEAGRAGAAAGAAAAATGRADQGHWPSAELATQRLSELSRYSRRLRRYLRTINPESGRRRQRGQGGAAGSGEDGEVGEVDRQDAGAHAVDSETSPVQAASASAQVPPADGDARVPSSSAQPPATAGQASQPAGQQQQQQPPASADSVPTSAAPAAPAAPAAAASQGTGASTGTGRPAPAFVPHPVTRRMPTGPSQTSRHVPQVGQITREISEALRSVADALDGHSARLMLEPTMESEERARVDGQGLEMAVAVRDLGMLMVDMAPVISNTTLGSEPGWGTVSAVSGQVHLPARYQELEWRRRQRDSRRYMDQMNAVAGRLNRDNMDQRQAAGAAATGATGAAAAAGATAAGATAAAAAGAAAATGAAAAAAAAGGAASQGSGTPSSGATTSEGASAQPPHGQTGGRTFTVNGRTISGSQQAQGQPFGTHLGPFTFGGMHPFTFGATTGGDGGGGAGTSIPFPPLSTADGRQASTETLLTSSGTLPLGVPLFAFQSSGPADSDFIQQLAARVREAAAEQGLGQGATAQQHQPQGQQQPGQQGAVSAAAGNSAQTPASGARQPTMHAHVHVTPVTFSFPSTELGRANARGTVGAQAAPSSANGIAPATEPSPTELSSSYAGTAPREGASPSAARAWPRAQSAPRVPAPEAGGATERGGAQEAGVLHGDEDIVSVLRRGCEGNSVLFQILTSLLGGNELNGEMSIGEMMRNMNQGARSGAAASGQVGAAAGRGNGDGQVQTPAASGGGDHGRTGIQDRLFKVVMDELTLRELLQLLMGQYQILDKLHQPLRVHLMSEIHPEAGGALTTGQVEGFAKDVVNSMLGSVEEMVESLSACNDAEALGASLFELIEYQLCDVMSLILADRPPATASDSDSFAMAIREWLGTLVHQVVLEIQGHVQGGGFESASNIFVELVQRRLQSMHSQDMQLLPVLGQGGSVIGNALVDLMTGVQASLSERARGSSGGGVQEHGGHQAVAQEERASWLETVRRDRERQRGHAAESAAPGSEAGAARSKRRNVEGGSTQGEGRDQA